MGRIPEPWARKGRGWFVELDGRQIKLAPHGAPKTEARKALNRLLAERDRGRRAALAPPEVGELVARFLDDVDRRAAAGEVAPTTPADYTRRLADFAEVLGPLNADAIRPKDIVAWVASHPAWGPTTRHDAVGAVKAVFRWARREGHLEADPLAEMPKPPRNVRRAEIMDGDAVPEVLAAIVSPDFRDLMLFLWRTGARPKEARTLEAAQVDWRRAVAVLADHKSARKTGRRRVVPLAWDAYFIAWRNAERHPIGPIFRNEDGRPWTKDAINCQVRRLRERAGLGREVVAYALRHVFATGYLEQTGDLAAAAAILGHAGTSLLGKVYSHLDSRHEHLRRQVDAFRPETASPRGEPSNRTADGESTPGSPPPAPAPPPRGRRADKPGGRRG